MKNLDKAQKIFGKYSGKDTLYFTSDSQPFFDANAAANHAKSLKDTSVETITRAQADNTVVVSLELKDRAKLEVAYKEVTGNDADPAMSDGDLSLAVMEFVLKAHEAGNEGKDETPEPEPAPEPTTEPTPEPVAEPAQEEAPVREAAEEVAPAAEAAADATKIKK